MKDKRRVIPFRRKRIGKTNYRKRIAYLSSGLPRLVIRKSLKGIYAQIVTYEAKGDRVLASASSSQLKKIGWNLPAASIPAAYLVGFLIGKKALEVNIKKAILDLGLYQPSKGAKIYAALKGAVDAGLEVPYDKSIIPNEERIKGKHISDYKKIDVEKEFNAALTKIKGTK